MLLELKFLLKPASVFYWEICKIYLVAHIFKNDALELLQIINNEII